MLNGKAQVKAKGVGTRTFGTSQCSHDLAAMFAQSLLDRKLYGGEQIEGIRYIVYGADGGIVTDIALETESDYFFA